MMCYIMTRLYTIMTEEKIMIAEMIQKSESQEFDDLNDKFLNFRMDELI